VTVAWTTAGLVAEALGPSASPAPDDPYLATTVAAANAAAYRKRAASGYLDDSADQAPAPSPDVGFGTTLWAVALWRERASTDGYGSFEDLAAYQPTGGSWGTIKRLLGITRAQTDTPDVDAAVLEAWRTRRRKAWSRLR
jgi:hypothetical protein